jgi:hypothetical protein
MSVIINEGHHRCPFVEHVCVVGPVHHLQPPLQFALESVSLHHWVRTRFAVVDFAVAVDGGGTGTDVVVAVVVVVVLKESSAALAFAVLPTVDHIGGKAPVHMSEAVEGCKELANAAVVLALTLVSTTWKLEEAVAVFPSSHPQNYDDQVDAAVSLVGCHVVGWLG